MRKNKTLLLTIPMVLVLGIFVIYEYGYLRLKEEISIKREIRESKYATLTRYMKTTSEIPDLEKTLGSLHEDRKNRENTLFQGQTHSVAASTLLDTIKNIITAREGTIHGQRIDPVSTAGKFKIVSVNIGATIKDARALTDILYAIQTNKPFISIKELDVRVQNLRDPRQLSIHMTVTGLTEAK